MELAPGAFGLRELELGRQQFVEFVRRRVSDPELAEDIVHDSLLKALKAAPELRDKERIIPWFYSVLRNAVVDHYRKRAVIQRHVEQTAEFPDLPDLTEDDERSLCECFRRLLPSLKPDYAQVIERLDLGDETPEAVAAQLSITPNNLKVRRHRARQALRRQLEDACGICAKGGCIDCDC